MEATGSLKTMPSMVMPISLAVELDAEIGRQIDVLEFHLQRDHRRGTPLLDDVGMVRVVQQPGRSDSSAEEATISSMFWSCRPWI